jgi:hypothetical protein
MPALWAIPAGVGDVLIGAAAFRWPPGSTSLWQLGPGRPAERRISGS